MEEFLKNKYGIDNSTRLSNEPKSYHVRDLIAMLRERGTEKNVINNLHNSALNKDQVLAYLENITNQITMEESSSGSFYQIETVLENLIKGENEAINRLTAGEISVDTYCDLLIGNSDRWDVN